MTVRVGISGWVYPSWRGNFYPRGLPQRLELNYVAQRMGSAEINSSFYRLQTASVYERWAEQTPPGFEFAVKGGRFITHTKRLREIDAPLANFFASGPLALGQRLGPVLWQLPQNLEPNLARLAEFLERLPRTTTATARLARSHDERLPTNRTWLRPGPHRPVRHVLEVRHRDFAEPGLRARLVALLRDQDVGLVISESAGQWPMLTDVSADLVYVRLHGDRQLYTSGYGPVALRRWADRIEVWREDGRDVYVYFDNDAKGRAPHDALALQRLCCATDNGRTALAAGSIAPWADAEVPPR